MFLYCIRFSDYGDGTIKIERFEVEKETSKCFMLVDRSRILKDDLDEIDDTSLGYKMWTREPDVDIYKEKVGRILKDLYAKYLKRADDTLTALRTLVTCENIKNIDE